MSALGRHNGGCHCGDVRFEVLLPPRPAAQTCTCSMCSKVGFVHIIVPPSRFSLSKGQGDLVAYSFNTGIAQHLFCRRCGVKSFYRPRSNPDGWSVNARCLDEAIELDLTVFDGANWEAHAQGLAHLSVDSHAPSA